MSGSDNVVTNKNIEMYDVRYRESPVNNDYDGIKVRIIIKVQLITV